MRKDLLDTECAHYGCEGCSLTAMEGRRMVMALATQKRQTNIESPPKTEHWWSRTLGWATTP